MKNQNDGIIAEAFQYWISINNWRFAYMAEYQYQQY